MDQRTTKKTSYKVAFIISSMFTLAACSSSSNESISSTVIPIVAPQSEIDSNQLLADDNVLSDEQQIDAPQEEPAQEQVVEQEEVTSPTDTVGAIPVLRINTGEFYEGVVSLDQDIRFQTDSANSVFLIGLLSFVDLFVFDAVGNLVCSDQSMNSDKFCGDLVVGDLYDIVVRGSYDDPINFRLSVFDQPLPFQLPQSQFIELGQQLFIGDLDQGNLEQDEVVRYETYSATSVILQSDSGNANLHVFDPTGFMICESNTTNFYDICPKLEIGIRYEIEVSGVTAGNYTISIEDTPNLSRDSIYSASVAAGDRSFFIASNINAVNLTSISGNADLIITNEQGENICLTNRTNGFDSCNNVDGSNVIDLDVEQQYIVSIDGISDTNYDLQTYVESSGTADLLQGFDAVESISNTSVNTYFVGNVTSVLLFAWDVNADLTVHDATTNELVCTRINPSSGMDSCPVPEGNYRISVIGNGFGTYDLSVGIASNFDEDTNLGRALNALRDSGRTDYVTVHNNSGLGSIFDDNAWTVFIPDNISIDDSILTADQSVSFSVLNDHTITVGAFSTADLSSLGTYLTNSGLVVTFGGTASAPTINGFSITPFGVEGVSSALYLIDGFLQ